MLVLSHEAIQLATLVDIAPCSLLAASVSSIFGNPSEQNRIMAGAIILYSAAYGFFAAYIGARSIISFLFYLSPSDWLPERQHTRAEQGTGGAEESQVEHSNPSGSNGPSAHGT